MSADSDGSPAAELRESGGHATAMGVLGADRYEVVVVSYHSKDQVAGLLDAAAVPEQRIVLVDNASGADGVADLLARFTRGRYLDGQNSGFAAAANQGARSSSAEYLIFANPDSRPTPQIWAALIDDLVSDPDLTVAAAATVDPHGRIEIGVGGWEPTVRRCLVHAVGLHRLRPTAGVYARPRPGEPVALGWITGACMAVRRTSFLALGGFNERYFVYNEDMAFGREVARAGQKQVLRTDLLVMHNAGGSGGGSRKMPQQRGASMAAYLRDRNRPAAATTMRATLAAGTLARALIAVFTGHRAIALRHLAYLHGITTGRSPYRPG